MSPDMYRSDSQNLLRERLLTLLLEEKRLLGPPGIPSRQEERGAFIVSSPSRHGSESEVTVPPQGE